MVTLIASLVSFLAATLTLVAFAIDIALFALVRQEMDRLGAGSTTKTGPGSSIPISRNHQKSNPLSLVISSGTNLVVRLFPCRFLDDLCLPYPSPPRGLHCLLWTSQGQALLRNTHNCIPHDHQVQIAFLAKVPPYQSLNNQGRLVSPGCRFVNHQPLALPDFFFSSIFTTVQPSWPIRFANFLENEMRASE